MSNRLEALENWAGGLLGQLEPASRKTLTRNIGQALRRTQQQRIIAQRNPEGSRYAPRKQYNLREKQGRMKQKAQMFAKLRKVNFLKVETNERKVEIGFTGRPAQIARVHQFGLKDRATTDARKVRYAKRKILGITRKDIKQLNHILSRYLYYNDSALYI